MWSSLQPVGSASLLVMFPQEGIHGMSLKWLNRRCSSKLSDLDYSLRSGARGTELPKHPPFFSSHTRLPTLYGLELPLRYSVHRRRLSGDVDWLLGSLPPATILPCFPFLDELGLLNFPLVSQYLLTFLCSFSWLWRLSSTSRYSSTRQQGCLCHPQLRG